MKSFFPRQIAEISADRALRRYGSFLALAQVLAAIYWFFSSIKIFAIGDADVICWPFLADCHALRIFSAFSFHAYLMVYLIASIAVGWAFLDRRQTARAYYGLIAVNLLKAVILAQDFRLGMNQHIMTFVATFVFLLFPHKRAAIRCMLVSFYFWAGILKLSPEWLSGRALYGELWIFSGEGLAWACRYVLVLELGMIWGLFSRRDWIFWGVFAQLCVFHLFSFTVVGFYYPLLMYTLLAIFPLCRLEGDRTIAWRGLGWVNAAALALFAFFQLLPKAYPGDSAVTGQGRMFALHMFDAKVHCSPKALLKYDDRPTEELDLRTAMPIRIHCDPIVFWNRARDLCRAHLADPHFRDLDLRVRTRTESEREPHDVISIEDFCRVKPTYSTFWPNDWIKS